MADVPRDEFFDSFGTPATVTPPGAEPIAATGFWVSPMTEDMPGGFDLQRRVLRRVFVLRRSEVPSLPLKSIILAADINSSEVRRWRVDGFDRDEPDIVRAIVVVDEEET